MKLLYLECAMGASGDMLLGALAGLLDDPHAFVREMNALGLPGVRVEMEPSAKCGISGIHMSVTVHGEAEESLDVHGDGAHVSPHAFVYPHAHEHAHEHMHEHVHAHEHEHAHEHAHAHHHHAGMREIESIIAGLPVSDTVRRDALAVYALIAQAEAEAHGRPVEEIHFHEVGSLDAVADIVGVSMLMERIAPDRVIASPVSTGYGHVRCAHGILPVPAPATASILRGVPCNAGRVEGELCTPTGAALLKYFVDAFGPMEAMATERIGYGMGKKDFPVANCLRAFLGEHDDLQPRVAELRCNLDDMTPEAVAFASEALLSAGALDVYTAPLFMKKNRPGVLLGCICPEDEAPRFARLMLEQTTTLGVRCCVQERYILATRTQETRPTRFGPVRFKRSEGYGVRREKPESDDVARIAREANLSFPDAARAISQEGER